MATRSTGNTTCRCTEFSTGELSASGCPLLCSVSLQVHSYSCQCLHLLRQLLLLLPGVQGNCSRPHPHSSSLTVSCLSAGPLFSLWPLSSHHLSLSLRRWSAPSPTAISSMYPLLILGFVLFVLTLQKDLYQTQFSMVTHLISSVKSTSLPAVHMDPHYSLPVWFSCLPHHPKHI